MKFTLKFDGNTDRKSLRGFFVADDKGQPVTNSPLMPIWLRASGFPDGLPEGFEVTMTPINGAKKAPAKKTKPATDKAADKAAEKAA